MKPFIRFSALILLVPLILLLEACTTTGERMRPSASEYPRETSYAIEQTISTSLGFVLRDKVKDNPKKSGFRILDTGRRSLDARMGLIRMAEKTLDLQYYAVHDDITSNLLIEAAPDGNIDTVPCQSSCQGIYYR